MKTYFLSIATGLLLFFGITTSFSCSKGSDDVNSGDSKSSVSKSNESGTTKSEPENTGSNLPEFSSDTVNGSTISSEDLKGKIVMFNYWGTWCPPCVREIPHFQETYEQYKEKGFTIVGIAVPQGGQGGVEDVRSFMEKNDVTYPVIMQKSAPNKKLQGRYGRIKAVPTSFLLDRNGNHVDTFVGYTEKKKLLNALTPLLEQKNK